jgi:Na+/proline symporter
VEIDLSLAAAAFGDSARRILSPLLQGLMLACIMAEAMSSGNAFQVTVAGLFSENLYRCYIHPSFHRRSLHSDSYQDRRPDLCAGLPTGRDPVA